MNNPRTSEHSLANLQIEDYVLVVDKNNSRNYYLHQVTKLEDDDANTRVIWNSKPHSSSSDYPDDIGKFMDISNFDTSSAPYHYYITDSEEELELLKLLCIKK